MTGERERIYGGVGVMLADPRTEVIAEPSDRWIVEPTIDDCRTSDELTALFARFTEITDRCARVRIEARPGPHIGFGSKTALILSVVEAACAATGLSLSRVEKIRLSGRGGTSGIGIWGFFLGGVIADAGRARKGVSVPGPSSVGPPTDIPSLKAHMPFPSDWEIVLIQMPGARISGVAERNVFRGAFPIPAAESSMARTIVDERILPAFENRDISLLRSAMLAFNSNGFKVRELAVQHADVRAAYRTLCAVETLAPGMSSMGPVLFGIVPSNHKSSVESFLSDALRKFDAAMSWSSGTNQGARVLPA